MPETAILFSSRYGSSKEYALMLKEKTGAAAIGNDKLTPSLVAEFGSLILVGGVYMGKIEGLDFFRDYATELRASHKLAVLAVGLAPEGKEYYAKLYEDNFKNHLQGIPMFYARGRLEMDKLSFVDKNLMKAFQKLVKGRKELSGFAKEITENRSLDYISEDYLDELLVYLRATTA